MKSTLTKPYYKLADLVDGLEVTIQGNPNCIITGISPIQKSEPGHITFLTNSNYRKYLSTTQASAVILSDKDAEECAANVVISSNPYFIYAKIAAFFDQNTSQIAGIHSTVRLGKDTKIDSTAAIGANCVIGDGVTIAAGVVIQPGCVIGNFVEIDEETQLDANVTIYPNVSIGKRCCISSGVVIGSSGFGFANQDGSWHKIPQLGSVQIGNDVDIGANTTIDRGALDNTLIEDGVKLDNLIQVGHNVRIGANTVIAGCVGIAGSANIGKNCMIGGASCINGHITICDNVIVTGLTGVSKSITEPGMYSSGIVGVVPHQEFCKHNARFHRLGHLMDRVKKLESGLKEIKEESKA